MPAYMLDVVGGELWTPRRLTLRGKKWKYRGEGNANLVLALPQERKIMRFRKCDGAVADGIEEMERERVCREALFCRFVMVPLLGDCYIQPPVPAVMNRAEVSVLNQVLQSQRPASRHHKGLCFSHVTVYPDYAQLPLSLAVNNHTPTFCVEIKPKQGWVPYPDRRMPKCTFCLNQYLKIKCGSIRGRSHYCPLDLFSGNHCRMKRALGALLVTPQNNLKIFEDGVLVYGEETSSEALTELLQRWLGDPKKPFDHRRLVEKFCFLILEALTREIPFPGKLKRTLEITSKHCQPLVTSPGPERIPSALTSAVSQLLPGPPCDSSFEPLPQDCILARILKIQQLDQTGADKVYQMYRSRGNRVRGSDYSYVAAMLKSGPDLSPLHHYLLATTARDCSIMMAFQRLPDHNPRLQSLIPTNHVACDLDAFSYVFNIGVSDLDPKPLSCIEKHRKRDYEVLSACLELLQPSSDKDKTVSSPESVS